MNNDKNIILHSATNEENNAFVGLRIKNDEVHFYYPESYALAPKEDRKAFCNDVVNIIRTISLAKSKSTAANQSNAGINQCGQFAVMSYLWVIRDYLNNGYYLNTEKIFKTNAKGRVNWKKTLNTQPIISNGNIVYNNICLK